jgi:hypothetical protein
MIYDSDPEFKARYARKKLAILTDRSGIFTASAVADFCKGRDILLVHTAAAEPNYRYNPEDSPAVQAYYCLATHNLGK